VTILAGTITDDDWVRSMKKKKKKEKKK